MKKAVLQKLRRTRSARKVKSLLTDNRFKMRSAERVVEIALLGSLGRETVQGEGHLLIASTGVSNIGDQAMLNAFLRATGGDVTVVTQPGATYTKEESTELTRFVELSGLFAPRANDRLRAFRDIGVLVKSHRTISIVGADIIDGGYSRTTATSLWTLARLAADAGKDVRILGFSWGERPNTHVVDAAQRATRAGVQAIVRDPDSYERARQDHLANLTSASDMAFSLPAPSLAPHAASKRAVVNLSGLIHQRVDLKDDYLQIIRWLIGKNYEVTLLPHVANASGDDSDVIRAVLNLLDPGERSVLNVVEQLLTPRGIQELVQAAELVVTGRMHLSILAATTGVPSIVLATQGKVAGLQRMLGLPDWVVDPERGVGGAVISLLRKHRLDESKARITLEMNLKEVVAKSERNFEGLAS